MHFLDLAEKAGYYFVRSKNLTVTKGFGRRTFQRIPELDGLRGIAISLVISFHYINNQLLHTTDPIGTKVAFITSFGWVGVDLFFVLSGFLIGSILIRHKKSLNYFSTFYMRRVVRILPNYFLFLLLFFTGMDLPYFSENYFLAGNNVIPGWSYFLMTNNLYMAYLENLGNTALSVTWSIGIEEQFYLIFPFVIYFGGNKVLPYLLVAIIVTASFFRLQFTHWIPAYVLLPCRMDALAMGVLVAYVNFHKDLKVLVSKYFWFVIAPMIFDLLICGFLYYLYSDLGVIKHSLFAFFFTGCLVLALSSKVVWYSRFLRFKLLMWVGTISYSLYLFHYFLLGVAHHIIGNKQGIGIYHWSDILITLIALVVTVVVSWLVYKKIEMPMVEIGKKYKY